MSKSSPLLNIFNADPGASVISMPFQGLSLPKVESAGLLARPDYKKVEGRGTYDTLGDGTGSYRYAKGSGNVESLRSHTEGDPRKFPQFGHRSPSEFCFGSSPGGTTVGEIAPRVRGALALPFAVAEVVNATVFLDVLMRKEGISTTEMAQAKGLTVPEGVIFSPGVSADICDGLARMRRSGYVRGPQTQPEYKYGLAALRVPACERLRTRDDVSRSKGEFWGSVLKSTDKMEMVGRVLKYQLEGGFISLSTHLQNVYNAPDSLCPHADSSDLVPISEILLQGRRSHIPPQIALEATVMRQLLYLPFNLMRYSTQPDLQGDAKGAIRTILNTVAPGEWSARELEALAVTFPQKPHSVLTSIAKRLIEIDVVTTSAQADWQKLRGEFSQFGYDIVSEHLIGLALTGACSLYTGIADAEARGGLSGLW
jgi:hypothetical protein